LLIVCFSFKTDAKEKIAVVQFAGEVDRKRAGVVPAWRNPPMEMRGQVD